jgi:hypothetical protein
VLDAYSISFHPTLSESVVITTEDFGLFELHFRFLVPGVGGLLPTFQTTLVLDSK